MEIKNSIINVYGRECVGCKRHDKYIMIAISDSDEDNYGIHDVFLTKKEAEDLINKIKEAMK